MSGWRKVHIHTTFCIYVNGPKKSGYDSTYYILHFSILRFGLHTTFYICDFECLLKLHTTFYIFDFRPGTYIRHLHLPVGEVNRAASTFYIWRVDNRRANSYTYYIPDPAYIRPALIVMSYCIRAMTSREWQEALHLIPGSAQGSGLVGGLARRQFFIIVICIFFVIIFVVSLCIYIMSAVST